jgi:hypothetical protein
MGHAAIAGLVVAMAAGLAGGAAAQPAAAAPPAEPGIRLRLADHPTIEFGNLARVELRGRFDADAVWVSEWTPVTDSAWTGRRIGAAFDIGRHVEGEVSAELGARRPWRDVYVTWRAAPWLFVRTGRFKIPFSEERLRSLGEQDFIERSLPARVLAPGRDVGVLAGGRVGGRRLEWESGAFQGRGDAWPHDSPLDTTAAGRLFAVRVRSRPFGESKTPWRSLRGAVSIVGGNRSAGLTSLEGRTTSDRAIFTLPVFVQGAERRLGLDAQWAPGRLRFGGEWMRVAQQRREQAIDGGDLGPLEATGWYGSAVWRVYHRPKGERSLAADWLRTIDVGIRVEGTTFDAELDDGGVSGAPEVLALPRYRALTLGTTWTVHRWLAVQLNGVRERLDQSGIAIFPTGTRTSASVRLRVMF